MRKRGSILVFVLALIVLLSVLSAWALNGRNRTGVAAC